MIMTIKISSFVDFLLIFTVTSSELLRILVDCLWQVWDVLTNNEVIRIVASAEKRSMAAKLLVNRAVRAWRRKYPCSCVDDCAVICLFLTNPPTTLTKSVPEVTSCDASCSRPLDRSMSFRCKRQGSKKVK